MRLEVCVWGTYKPPFLKLTTKAPENLWLEDEMSLQNGAFSGDIRHTFVNFFSGRYTFDTIGHILLLAGETIDASRQELTRLAVGPEYRFLRRWLFGCLGVVLSIPH